MNIYNSRLKHSINTKPEDAKILRYLLHILHTHIHIQRHKHKHIHDYIIRQWNKINHTDRKGTAEPTLRANHWKLRQYNLISTRMKQLNRNTILINNRSYQRWNWVFGHGSSGQWFWPGQVGSGNGSVCQTRCLTYFWVLTCAFIVALFLQTNTISAN